MERLTRDAVIAALRAVGTEHEHEWLTERGKQAHKVVEKLADWLEGDAKSGDIGLVRRPVGDLRTGDLFTIEPIEAIVTSVGQDGFVCVDPLRSSAADVLQPAIPATTIVVVALINDAA
jgi:hypothetical protein